MINVNYPTLSARLIFMLTSALISTHAMAREPYLNNGHFSGLNDQWGLEQTNTDQNTAAMTPADRASRNCDWPVNDKPETRDNQDEKAGANKTGVH